MNAYAEKYLLICYIISYYLNSNLKFSLDVTIFRIYHLKISNLIKSEIPGNYIYVKHFLSKHIAKCFFFPLFFLAAFNIETSKALSNTLKIYTSYI